MLSSIFGENEACKKTVQIQRPSKACHFANGASLSCSKNLTDHLPPTPTANVNVTYTVQLSNGKSTKEIGVGNEEAFPVCRELTLVGSDSMNGQSDSVEVVTTGDGQEDIEIGTEALHPNGQPEGCKDDDDDDVVMSPVMDDKSPSCSRPVSVQGAVSSRPVSASGVIDQVHQSATDGPETQAVVTSPTPESVNLSPPVTQPAEHPAEENDVESVPASASNEETNAEQEVSLAKSPIQDIEKTTPIDDGSGPKDMIGEVCNAPSIPEVTVQAHAEVEKSATDVLGDGTCELVEENVDVVTTDQSSVEKQEKSEEKEEVVEVLNEEEECSGGTITTEAIVENPIEGTEEQSEVVCEVQVTTEEEREVKTPMPSEEMETGEGNSQTENNLLEMTPIATPQPETMTGNEEEPCSEVITNNDAENVLITEEKETNEGQPETAEETKTEEVSVCSVDAGETEENEMKGNESTTGDEPKIVDNAAVTTVSNEEVEVVDSCEAMADTITNAAKSETTLESQDQAETASSETPNVEVAAMTPTLTSEVVASTSETGTDGKSEDNNIADMEAEESAMAEKTPGTSFQEKEGDHDSGVDESQEPQTNGDLSSPKKSPSKIPAPKKLPGVASPAKTSPSVGMVSPSGKSNGAVAKPSPMKTPPSSGTTPISPEPSSASALSDKKLPMNKVQVGLAASPNLKSVKSKIGSMDNARHRPGGGQIKIETKKVDFSKAQSRVGAYNDKYNPSGGDKKIQSQKLNWSAKSKIGSLDNTTYKPGGGDKKIESKKLDFKERASSKVGSRDNMTHQPGGGTAKGRTNTPDAKRNIVESRKLEFKEKAQSKIGSMDNVKHRPGGGEKKIFDDKEYLKQMTSTRASMTSSKASSKASSEGRASGAQSPSILSPQPFGEENGKAY